MLVAATTMVVLCLGCKKKKPPAAASPKKLGGKSGILSNPAIVGEPSTSHLTEFSDEAPSAFSQRETKRQNPLYRGSIGEDPRLEQADEDQDRPLPSQNQIERAERKNSVTSTYSGFGTDANSSANVSASGLTPMDKSVGYIGIAVSETPLAKPTVRNPEKAAAKKPSKKSNLEKSTSASANGSAISKSKPKSGRDLKGAKDQKEAERAARLAKMKAAREQKKQKEARLLEEALAVIDDLPE